MADAYAKTMRLPPLTRMSGLRQLGARILRETLRGERPVDEGSKLMAMVRVQAELVAATDLEQRVDDVEDRRKRLAAVPLRFGKLKEVGNGA